MPLYIVKKFIFAKDAKQAIKKEKQHPVDDVWMDDRWREEFLSKRKEIGFKK